MELVQRTLSLLSQTSGVKEEVEEISMRQKAYSFDGFGNFHEKEWYLDKGSGDKSVEFCWYHVEFPKKGYNLLESAEHLIDVLCPPLKFQDILYLVGSGPFCGHVDGALVFRVNSPEPASDSAFRIAARVTENSVITVSFGYLPRLDLELSQRLPKSVFRQVPYLRGKQKEGSEFLLEQNFLEYHLTMNHFEEADNPVPKSVSNLVVQIIDTYVDHLQDVVTKIEMELDTVEIQMDKGGFVSKKKMLDDRRFPKMHLDLLHILQVIARGEQVFLRVKEKCSSKHWFSIEDINSLEDLIGRLRSLKENVGFVANRVTAIQAGLDSWQAEQINRKLYYLSFLSIIFLPLSIITGVFGMNVGGVPWTGQTNPELKDGFHNVMRICVATLLLVLLCFIFPTLYTRLAGWQGWRTLKRSYSFDLKSFRLKPVGRDQKRESYNLL